MWNGFFRRAPAKSTEPLPHAWFDPKSLDTTFNELQAAVAETTSIASDISAQLENKLQVTEQTLATVMCVITEGIIITDSDCIIRDWNTGAEIIFGYKRDEVIGKHIDILVSHDDKSAVRSRFDQAEYSEKGNINRIRTMECHSKAGDELLVEISINTFPDSITSHKMVAIVRDITKQHKEQEIIKQNRLLLSTVIDAVSDVVIVRDGDGKWILLNRAGYNLYGFNHASDFEGRTNAELAEDYPFFADHLTRSAETDNEAWLERRTVRFETDVIDHQNQRQYFDVLKTPIFSPDKKREMLVVLARNVTALKEKREHILVAYKALNASSDMVIITDHEGKIVFVNKMFLIKYRFVDMRDALGQSMSIVRSTKTSDEVHQKLWATIKAGKTWEGIITNVDTAGRELKVQSQIIPIVDQALETSYFISIQKCLD